jgi:TRAP-type C4-dicarboxylate transport system substrate-binding protein
MVSDKVWKKLSAGDQKILKEVVSKQAALSITNARANDQKYLDLMKKKGIKVHMYTTKELKPMMDAFAVTWSQLDKSKGKGLMDEFKKEMKKISDQIAK